MSKELIKLITKDLKKELNNATEDFDFYLDQYLGKKQYKHNSEIVTLLVDDFFENYNQNKNLDINIMIKTKKQEADYLCFMFHPIDSEEDDYSFFLRVILDQYKKEDFNDYFEDTHGQKCKVYSDGDSFYWGIYNTGPHMVDSKINPSPPWRDEAHNRDIDGMMKLGKKQLNYLIPILEEYCYTDEGLNIPDEGVFKDLNGKDCNIGYSSVATYEGCWIGLTENNYRMHMNIPKMKNILEKIKLHVKEIEG